MSENTTQRLNRTHIVIIVLFALFLCVLFWVSQPTTSEQELATAVAELQQELSAAKEQIAKERVIIEREVHTIEKTVSETVSGYDADAVADEFNRMLGEWRNKNSGK